MTHPSYALTDAQIAAFQADGAVCLRAVFDAGEVAAIQAAVDEAMACPGPYALDFSGDGGGRFFGDVFVWTRIPALRELVVRSHLGEIAAKLMDARKVRFFFDHLLVKEPGTSAPTPWHQDAPYFPIEGGQCCSLWIALDPVTIENGAVEYVKSSHVPKQWYAPKSFHGDDRIGNAALATLPDIDARRAEFDIVSWDLEPGDCAVHHVSTIHGAPGNASSVRRRGLATRWIGDDIVFGLRSGIPDPRLRSLDLLAPELEPGKPFDGPIFPLGW
jgi:ectoine hydroxylase-related dioxygenase (phytanoyl-CoA dioxygenase family)